MKKKQKKSLWSIGILSVGAVLGLSGILILNDHVFSQQTEQVVVTGINNKIEYLASLEVMKN